MTNKCKIEWVAELARQRGMAPKSWNPVIGCSRASEGCRNCYAAGIAHRFGHHGFGVYAGMTERDQDGTPRFNGKIDFSEKRLMEPLRWRNPAVVFAGDMADLFHDNVTDAMLDRIFAVMAQRPDCLFLLLTKRPERMREYLNDAATPIRIASASVDIAVGDMRWSNPCGTEDWWPLPNVWLGVTAEDQPAANARIQHLLATLAVKRFVSVEPMLGPVDIGIATGGWLPEEGLRTKNLDWVICGGESGPNARPMPPDWPRLVRDQCQAAGVPFFFKQWGEWAPTERANELDGRRYREMEEWVEPTYGMYCIGKKAAGRLLDGREWDEAPV